MKFKLEGEHALRECAERITSRGESFSEATADASPSLDQLQERFGLGRYRALFRSTGEGRSFAAERRRMAERTERIRRRRVERGMASASAEQPPDLSHIYRVEIPEGVNPAIVAGALNADPHVEYAQPDYIAVLDQSLPFDDPYLGSYGSWGQPYADLWGLERVAAPEVWGRVQGDGAVVAVVDTGLDRFHPDIAANVWVNPGEDLNGDGLAGPEDENGLDDDDNGFIDDLTGFNFADSVDADEDGSYDGPADVSDPDPFDVAGHGTHVSGTIAAIGGNGIGIVGVAPRAKIMALKGFPDEGSAEDSVLWRAVLYAAENGATVVNNSWSCGTPCPVNPLAEDVLTMVEALGTVVVTSAGNRSTDVLFRNPENGPQVITVGSIGFDGLVSSFSNRGWGIDLVAPGGGPSEPFTVPVARRNILSLLTSAIESEEEIFSVGDDYWRLAGTSMSAPHVAGAVALLRTLRSELSPEQVRQHLRVNARDTGLAGPDPFFGSGVLDLPSLLEAEPLDLALSVEAPAPGSLHDPKDGPVVVLGRADGSELDRFDVDVSSGMSGRDFHPLDVPDAPDAANADESITRGGVRVLARWDIEDVSDGPYTLRVRAHLVDGRVVDEYRVISIERNTPLRISSGDLAVGAPDLSGRRVVWPTAESEEPGAPFDLWLGRFAGVSKMGAKKLPPIPLSKPLFEREGDQDDVAIDGRIVAWRIRNATEGQLEACLIEGHGLYASQCDPMPIDHAPGIVSAPWAAGGWIVWQRQSGPERFIEGCRVDRRSASCRPRDLIDASDSTFWTLRSFDGKSLLLQGGGELSLCPLRPEGEGCLSEPVLFPPGSPAVYDPVHDGSLLAFTDSAIESSPPVGCLPGEVVRGCEPTAAVIVRYRACWLDPETNECDSIQISEGSRVEYTEGLTVSRRRIAWPLASATEESSIRFCEFQPLTKECPEQRLSGSAARQDEVAMDDQRLVWRDARAGENSIWSYALPDLSGSVRRTYRAGRKYSIPVLARRGTSTALHYELESLDGLPSDSATLKVKRKRRDREYLRLKGFLPADAQGVYRWRVRAIGSGGLYSEWVAELKVTPAPPSAAAPKPRWSRPGLRRSDRDPEKASKPDR